MYLQQNFLDNFLSSIIIQISFFISILFACAYQKYRVYNNNGVKSYRKLSIIEKYFWIFLIVILPAIVVGFRAFTVGADTENNVSGYLNDGSTFSFKNISWSRYIFELIKFITYHLSDGNPTFFLFILAFLTLFILVLGLDKLSLKFNIGWSLFIYYTILGMQLLNQSRQMLALSVFFYSIHFFISKKWVIFFLTNILASLIHFTSIIGLILPIFYFSRDRFYPLKKISYLCLWGIIPLVLPNILSVASIIVPENYSHYIESATYDGLGLGLVLSVFPIVLPICLLGNNIHGTELGFYVRTALLVIPIRIAGYYSYFLMRLQYYPMIFMILIIPLALNNVEKRYHKNILSIIMILICLIYFIIYYVYLNTGLMLPFESIFK